MHGQFVAHPDGSITDLGVADGVLDSPQGSFDEKKFASAAVHGIVPLSDGSSVGIDLTWDMSAAPIHHRGNDSAYNPNNGIDRHFADRCRTLNQLAHQQWRSGAPGLITGSIDGRNVATLFRPDLEPFIAAKSVFTYVEADHGGCA